MGNGGGATASQVFQDEKGCLVARKYFLKSRENVDGYAWAACFPEKSKKGER